MISNRRLGTNGLIGLHAPVPWAARRFVDWWLAELKGLVPHWLTRGPVGPEAAVILTIERDGIRITGIGAHLSETSAETVTLTDLRLFFARQTKLANPPTIGLKVPYDVCFSRKVRLPRRAERDFAKLLALDLERATPFKIQNVYTGYVVHNDAGHGPHADITQLIVKRSLVDDVKNAAEDAGLEVVFLQCSTPDQKSVLPANLFAMEPSDQRATVRSGLTTALAALVAVLTLSACYLDISRHQIALAELEAQNAKFQAGPEGLLEASGRSNTIRTQVAELNRLRRNAVSHAAIIVELTGILPDSAWVNELTVNASTVEISGLADAASAILPLIEQSPLFVDATNAAPVTQDPTGKDRFDIRLRLENSATTTPENVEASP